MKYIVFDIDGKCYYKGKEVGIKQVIIMDDIIGSRYWYNKSKQYGYELVSFKIDKFWNKETKKPFYKPYVDVLLKKSKLQSKKNYSSIEGYLDVEMDRCERC